MSNWIDAKERHPINGKLVIACARYDPDSEESVIPATWCNGASWQDGWYDVNENEVSVRLWMEFPELPETKS